MRKDKVISIVFFVMLSIFPVWGMVILLTVMGILDIPKWILYLPGVPIVIWAFIVVYVLMLKDILE